jgi:hypothetical protein
MNVMPASEARRESFLKKDAGQTGMTNQVDSNVFLLMI